MNCFLIILFLSTVGHFEYIGSLRIFANVLDIWSQMIPEMNNLLQSVKESGLPLWSFNKGLGV